MQKKQLVIIGAGGFAREALWLVEDINSDSARWEVLGFIDEDPAKKGALVNDFPILGDLSWFEGTSPDMNVIFAVGSPVGRKKLVDKCDKIPGLEFPNLIHPSIRLCKHIEMGKGNIICKSSILTTNIHMGSFNIINLNCTVGHDVVIKDFCTAAPGVNISGRVTLNSGCDLGTNTCIIQEKTIGEWTVIGAGSVVIRDIEPRCTAVGVPAKIIKRYPEEGKLQ
ncbi:MAG: transferase [Clostridiales bacterium GWC2_40_7]|nr:MAG: transferase [Clostridiales bacterium GWC2_40_7]